MTPKRLVDLLFLYAGLLNAAQYALAHGLRVELGSAWQLLAGLIFCLIAATRWNRTPEEVGPNEYGPLIYALVALCAVLTLLTAGIAVA
ncbi:hypothetical protein [Halostella litorea]|uniref:hypothetical protein n=1 Tax=Halostella litorea TaxID=2528831 RepID=UPI0010922773|nr:hypothetical protein [Halostella litorea]